MKRRISFNVPVLVSMLLCSLASAAGQEPVRPATIAITGVTVVDVRGGEVLRDRTVVITGSRIADVATRTDVRIPPGAQLVDGQGRYLIPGLWDMHVHQVRNFLTLYIANGVTGTREMGSPLPLPDTVALRRRIEQGERIGPRFFSAGPIVDGRPTVTVRLGVGTLGAMNPEEGRTAVDSLHRAGADFIKVYQRLDRATYLAIADEAKRQGIPFAGHLPQAITLDEAGRSGQRSIEHLTLGNASGLLPLCSSQEDALRRGAEEQFQLAVASSPNDPSALPPRREWMKLAVESFDEERCLRELRRLAAHGTWHTPTLMAGMRRGVHDDSILKDPRLDYAAPVFRPQWEKARLRYVSMFSETETAAFFRLLLRIVSILQRAGVGLLAGTDGPVASAFAAPGFSLHQELELLVSAGLTPIEALRTATLQPARYFGMEDTIGTVEPGKLADLVLLNANPLEDIRHTQRIQAVVANGRYFDRTALDALLAEAKASAVPRLPLARALQAYCCVGSAEDR
jgi:imidazolonepropionase-like amidohydrolase